MAAGAETFWRLLPDVRVDERPRFLFFASLLTLISLAQTLGLAGTEALFLAEFGVGALPAAFIAASLVTVLGSFAYALRVGSARNDPLFIQMLVGAAVALSVATVGVASERSWLLPVLLCFWYLTQAVFMSHFWTFSSDYFGTQASKRLVPLFTVGASLGGVLGGLLAAGLTQVAGAASLIGGWGAALLAAAALLRLSQSSLRRWGPLDLEEADETSMESLRGALRFLRASSLARWLVVAALGMVLALFLAQFLYLDIFSRRFPDPAELAFFLAIYFATTNLIEIFIELKVTPWLIRKLGVPSANLIHPGMMLVAFAGLASSFGMPAGLAARMARELMENALAAPVRALMYNAMPLRFRGRTRAFVEGIVVYAGMAVAGLVLLTLQQPEPIWLCTAGALASCLYLFAGHRAKRAYVATLLDQLARGRIDLEGVEGDLGSWEAGRLAELWEESLRTEGRRPSAALLQLIPALAGRGIIDPLARGASHPNTDVRRACIDALAQTPGPSIASLLALALDDPAPGVRLAALRGLTRRDADITFVQGRLTELLEDLDPRVRAEAACHAGSAGIEILAKMIASQSAKEAVPALGVAQAPLLDSALDRLDAPEPAIRAGALACAARLAVEAPIEIDPLLKHLRDPDEGVRRAAIQLGAGYDDEQVLEAIADRLDDPTPEVQATAELELGRLGKDGLAAVEGTLSSDHERGVAAALRVVANSDADDARETLLVEMRRHVHAMWYFRIGAQRLPSAPDTSVRFVRAAFHDAMDRERRLAFRTLDALENPTIVRKIERELQIGTPRGRDNALEILSHMGDREAAGLMLLMYESGPFAEQARIAGSSVEVPNDVGALLHDSRGSELRWIREGAMACAPMEGDPPPEENRMERLLALKQVSLFEHLSLEQLDALLQTTEEVEYLDGELICRQDERGDCLYVLLEGSVSIIESYGTSAQRELKRLGPVEYFGEMASLVDQRRTATALAIGRCTLLSLEGGALKELILQMPEISFEIFRVLANRLKTAEERARQK